MSRSIYRFSEPIEIALDILIAFDKFDARLSSSSWALSVVAVHLQSGSKASKPLQKHSITDMVLELSFQINVSRFRTYYVKSSSHRLALLRLCRRYFNSDNLNVVIYKAYIRHISSSRVTSELVSLKHRRNVPQPCIIDTLICDVQMK